MNSSEMISAMTNCVQLTTTEKIAFMAPLPSWLRAPLPKINIWRDQKLPWINKIVTRRLQRPTKPVDLIWTMSTLVSRIPPCVTCLRCFRSSLLRKVRIPVSRCSTILRRFLVSWLKITWTQRRISTAAPPQVSNRRRSKMHPPKRWRPTWCNCNIKAITRPHHNTWPACRKILSRWPVGSTLWQRMHRAH